MGRLIDETLRDVAYAWRGLRKAPGLHRRRAGHAGARRRRQHRHLQRRQRAAGPAAAVPRSRRGCVFVWADQTAEGYPRAPLSGPELQDLDDRAARFDGFGAIWATTAALTGENDPEQLRVGFVTTDYFSLLGADAALGRTFQTDDDSLAAPTTILLSAAVWQRRYGGDPGDRRPADRRQRPTDDRRRRDAGRLPADDAARCRRARRPRGVAAAQPALSRRAARAALPARDRPHASGRRGRRRAGRTSPASDARSRPRTPSTAPPAGSSRPCRCTSTRRATCDAAARAVDRRRRSCCSSRA